jgi:hypothetical protein
MTGMEEQKEPWKFLPDLRADASCTKTHRPFRSDRCPDTGSRTVALPHPGLRKNSTHYYTTAIKEKNCLKSGWMTPHRRKIRPFKEFMTGCHFPAARATSKSFNNHAYSL